MTNTPSTFQRKTRHAFWTILLGAVLGLGVVRFLPMVSALGQGLLQTDIQQDYLTGFIWAIVLGMSIWVWPVQRGDKRPLLLVWAVKCSVALGFMLYSESFYRGLDAFGYFEEGKHLDVDIQSLNFGGGTQIIVFFSWLHQRFIPDSYHALKVSFAMAGLLAVYLIYRAAVVFLGREDRRLLYILGLFPSALYWSSILGKDPIVLLGIAVYTYGVVRWHRQAYTRHLLTLVAGVLMASWIRPWLGPVLLLPFLFLAALKPGNQIRKIAILGSVAIAMVLFIAELRDRFELENHGDVLPRIGAISGNMATGGSGQEAALDLSNPGSMAVFLPLGMFTALFRPLPFEVPNLFGLLAGLENLALLGLFLRAIVRARRDRFRDPIILWAITLILVWAVLYASISYGNLGTAVRYRSQVLPLELAVILYLGSPISDRGRKLSPARKKSSPQ